LSMRLLRARSRRHGKERLIGNFEDRLWAELMSR